MRFPLRVFNIRRKIRLIAIDLYTGSCVKCHSEFYRKMETKKKEKLLLEDVADRGQEESILRSMVGSAG